MKIRPFLREVTAIAFLSVQLPGLSQLLVSAPTPQGTAASKKRTPEPDKLLTGPSFTLDQLLKLLDVHPDRLAKAITNRGLDFEATDQNVETLKKAGAPDKVVDVVRHIAPVKHVAPPPPPPPPKGNLLAKCSPAECTIKINGVLSGSTTSGTLEIKGLPPKEIVVDFEKDGYVGVQKTIGITQGNDVSASVELEPSEATKAQFGADLLSNAIQALGGDAGLADLASIYGSGAAVVWNKDGVRSDWTFNALLKLPNMILFDLESSSGKLWISLVGDKYKSGGDHNKVLGIFGAKSEEKNKTAAAGEFDSSLRLYRDFQVSAFLGRIRSSGFRPSALSPNEDEKGEFNLNAAGTTETYEVTLTHEKLPARLKYSSELGLGTGLEIVYSDYKDAGKGKYPLTTVMKLPDAPHHGIEVRLENVTLVPDLKEKDFNGRYKPRK